MRIIGLSCLLLFVTAPCLAAELQPFALDYQASYGSMNATASRSLSGPDANGQWELQSQVEVKLLGTTVTGIEERSRFAWHDDLPVSVDYRYVQKGIGHRERGVSFDSGGQHAQWTQNDNKGELTLPTATYDSLNSVLVLRHQLQGGGTEFIVPVADKSEISSQRYQTLGNEQLKTPAGTFATVHLRRVRDGDSKRTTDLWLAPALDHALVKLMQVEPDGNTILLVLKHGKVGAASYPAP